MKLALRLLAPALAVGLAAILAPAPAHACATAPPEGFRVAIAEEEALIVWDAAHKTEHFVRRAAFDTAAPSFGFLVPTPSQPTLAEAPDEVFERLREAIRPVVRHEAVHDVSLGCWSVMTFLARGTKSAAVAAAVEPPPVRVLDEQRVAGLDAVVLEADSTGALADWLKTHGYPLRPSLERWVAPYVAAKWKITAFKYSGPRPGEPSVGSRAVRLSFEAAKPFYPYREPDDAEQARTDPSAKRSLRLFLVGSARFDASLSETGTGWAAKVDYAASRFALGKLLEGAVPAGSFPPEGWLTSYLDDARVRPADDLMFALRPGGAPVIPPEVVVRESVPVVLPLEALVVVIPLGLWIARRRRGPSAAAARGPRDAV